MWHSGAADLVPDFVHAASFRAFDNAKSGAFWPPGRAGQKAAEH
jgi:hypothetical protein